MVLQAVIGKDGSYPKPAVRQRSSDADPCRDRRREAVEVQALLPERRAGRGGYADHVNFTLRWRFKLALGTAGSMLAVV